MKAQLLILYSVCIVSACLTSLSSVAHGDVRIGIPFQAQSPASIAGDTLAVAIRPLVSDDNVRLLSAEQLDGSDGALKAVSAGAIDIAILPSVTIAEGQAPGMAIFDMPYLFDDLSEVSKFQSTYVGEALLGSISDPNVVALGYWNLSMNLLFGPLIRSAEDFNGWTVLTTTSTYGQESVKALGAKPISEVGNDVAFTAFRTGNIDAAELAPTSKFFKQPDAPVSGLYVSEVAFRPVVAVVVANASFWESLSPSTQVALRRSISEIGETITKESTDRDAIAILELQKLGLKAAVVSPPVLKTLRQDVRSSWFAVGGLSPWLQHGLDVLEQLRKPAATSPKRSDKSADRPIRVFFGTDRQLQESQPGLDYGSGRAGLSFGIAETHVTSTSPVGGRPHDRLAIRDIQSMGSAEFQQSLSAALRDSRIRDVVVFVHGYNTNFGDSVITAASVSLDTKFRGIPVAFSWPSDGVALRYNNDTEEAYASRPNFVELIRILNKTPEVNAIHILAHSMGSRIVVDGLSTLEAVDQGLKIGHVLFAAPDIYSSIFEQGVPAMSALSRRVTLYASDKDRALHCSVLFNSNPRAGLGGSNILLHRDIDTIDMSEAEELPLVSVPCSAGHSYFWSNSAALGDIHELITYDAEPENRHRLERRSRGNQHFWILLRESL